MLFYEKEKPEIILSLLSGAYVDMYRVRMAIESGIDVQEIPLHFNYTKKEFLLKRAQTNSKGISTTSLLKMIDLLFEADKRIKSTSADKRIVIETLITQLFLTANRE